MNEDLFTAQDIISYITHITPEDSDVPDYFFQLIRKSNKKFEEKKLRIEDLLKSDSSLREYVESGEERYGDQGESDYEPHPSDIDNPIVVFKGEVIDGYSRTATKYRAGEEYIDAYVSV